MNVEEVGAAPMAGLHAPRVPPLSPIKGPPLLLSKHTSSRRISLPPLEFPHGLGSARYMFPVAIRQERVVLPLHR